VKLRYRCPACKRWLSPHWTDREDAAGLALNSIQVTVFVALVATGTLHRAYLLENWEIVSIVLFACVVAWVIYRLYLRRGRRYYCSSCDRVFRGDFLRSRSKAPQVTEIAS